MSTTFWRVHSRSFWGYLFLFGSLWGHTTYGVSADLQPRTIQPDIGLFVIWIAGAIIGSTLLVLRNRRISNQRVRRRLYLSDGLFLVVLVALIALTPVSLGLVRSALVLAVESAYVGVFFQLFYKGKLVPLDALYTRPN